ncbi:MAG: 2-hydroxycyclohexanecarboxyl-CoA dehydrogenase [Hyphomicrobiaceae bacterium]|jgi:2-hydroxycyclohexanecarboxyl-CoA dehydrogenase
MLDRVAVVTGAGRGIGRAIAKRACQLGLGVAVWDVDEALAVSTADEIGSHGVPAIGVGCDVRDRDAVAEAAERTRSNLGSVWAIVNNAGIDRLATFKESDPQDWRDIIDVNFVGALNVTHALLGDLTDRDAGRVVFVSSDAARVGSTGEAVYAGTKAALIGFGKTLARETARHGITVNIVCPGPTDTSLLGMVRQGPQGDKIIASMTRAVPLGRIAEPEDIAGAVAFFLGPDGGYVTGQVLSVSGGLTMAG